MNAKVMKESDAKVSKGFALETIDSIPIKKSISYSYNQRTTENLLTFSFVTMETAYDKIFVNLHGQVQLNCVNFFIKDTQSTQEQNYFYYIPQNPSTLNYLTLDSLLEYTKVYEVINKNSHHVDRRYVHFTQSDFHSSVLDGNLTLYCGGDTYFSQYGSYWASLDLTCDIYGLKIS